jgi:hypothetical protein
MPPAPRRSRTRNGPSRHGRSSPPSCARVPDPDVGSTMVADDSATTRTEVRRQPFVRRVPDSVLAPRRAPLRGRARSPPARSTWRCTVAPRLRIEHQHPTLLPRITLHLALPEAAAERAPGVDEQAPVQRREQAAPHAGRREHRPARIAEHRMRAGPLGGERRGHRRQTGADEAHRGAGRQQLGVGATQLRRAFAAQQSTVVPHEHDHRRGWPELAPARSCLLPSVRTSGADSTAVVVHRVHHAGRLREPRSARMRRAFRTGPITRRP